jgi:nitronate monooxygenase
MALRTKFTDIMGVQNPIVSAPMGGSAGGALAAAVSNGGGLGLIGGGRGDFDWIGPQIELAINHTRKPWGIGFLSWALASETLNQALELGPSAVMLSFGDPRPFAPAVRASEAKLILQVVDMDEARVAIDVGADIIVAQGSEAGGHGGTRATLPFVPAVVDLVSPTPVLAAGGIADGRGLAAALSLGAAGALVGTRFNACEEALVDPEVVKAMLNGHGEDTERSGVFDIARGVAWPARYTGRTIRNEFLNHWRSREVDLAADSAAREEYRHAEESGDMRVVPVWAGEAIDLITESLSAADVVRIMASDSEDALRRILREA